MVESLFSAIITTVPFVSLVVTYLLLFTSKKTSQKTSVVKDIKVGNKVLTSGGIIGYVAKTNNSSVILENYDGTLLEIHVSAIQEILES